MNTIQPYQDKLYRFALRLVNNTFDAEEIIQDLLVKIWKKRDDFKNLDNPEAWCMTVTRNLAYDKIRGRKQAHQEIEKQYDLRDAAVTPDIQLEQKDALARVKHVMNSLPDNLKIVLQLRDIEGYTYQEIADMQNWTLSKVKVYIHRARKSLQEALINIEL